MSRIAQIEQWLVRLDLAPLTEEEVLELLALDDAGDICGVFADLVYLCQKRFSGNTYWPDFSILGLSCPVPQKKTDFRPRIFAIGL